jgi:predicted GIY-YIG superfamily endonuclease
MTGPCFVYILECSDGTYYTGIAADVQRRLVQHLNGKGAKYTRGRLPVTLVWAELVGTRGEAAREERRIKKMGRAEKEEMMGFPE